MEPLRTTDATQIDFRKKFDLTDKVIVITGACGLVGRAFCEAVAQFGGIVVAADIELANPVHLQVNWLHETIQKPWDLRSMWRTELRLKG